MTERDELRDALVAPVFTEKTDTESDQSAIP